MNFIKNPVILQTDLTGIERHAQGKVRDVYSVDDSRLLIIASDRISAFDYILPTGIPDKGRVLTQLSIFWFDFLRDVTPTHFLTAKVDEYPEKLQPFRDQLEGRSMLVKRAQMFPIEPFAQGLSSEPLPAKYEWWFQFDVPSAGIPLTDSLVLMILSPEGKIVARCAARL